MKSEVDETEPSVLPLDPPPAGGAFSRRRVLVVGAAVALGGLGAGGLLAGRRLRAGKAPERTMRDHRVQIAKGKPPMVIARGPDPARNVRAALDAMGGVGAFVKKGEVVLVKPNIGWERSPAQAANTDPNLVAELVRLCLAAGASQVLVTDVSCHNDQRSFAKSGIEAAARAAGATVVLPSAAPRVALVGPGKLGRWEVPEPYLRADKIFNVPIAKHHGLTNLTAGLKNWLGVLHGGRHTLHARIDEALVELATLMKPTLTIVDATRVLLRNGPKGGNLADVKRFDALAVSIDPVAADAWAAQAIGKVAANIGHVTKAERRGLGKLDYQALGTRELNVG